MYGKNPNDVVAHQRTVVPFIDRSVWPEALMEQVPRLLASRLSIRIAAPITITTGGEYRLGARHVQRHGHALLIDGQRRDAHGLTAATLTPGRHELVVEVSSR